MPHGEPICACGGTSPTSRIITCTCCRWQLGRSDGLAGPPFWLFADAGSLSFCLTREQRPRELKKADAPAVSILGTQFFKLFVLPEPRNFCFDLRKRHTLDGRKHGAGFD